MQPIQARQLIDDYDALLLDAYGVLVDKTGPLPGACAFIDRLNALGKPYYLLTNSASRLPGPMAADLAGIGLSIAADRIITSGMLLAGWVERKGLQGCGAVVLGTSDSQRYAEQAGLRPLCLNDLETQFSAQVDPAAALVIADQAGFDLLPVINAVLGMLLRQCDQGRPPGLVLCNPDLIYPRAPGLFGFTAGSLAAMFEAVLMERYGVDAPGFDRLGKPNPPIFEEAIRRIGGGRVVMVGDQLATDIAGANRCGIDSVLVGTGLAGAVDAEEPVQPTWWMSSLLLDEKMHTLRSANKRKSTNTTRNS